MKLFGSKKDPHDPVPKNVQLTGKIKDEPIVLSKLTEEFIRQDLTSIRDIFVHMNEKLGTVVGFEEYLTDIENLVIRFGKAYDNLIDQVNAANARQESNQKEIIDMQLKIMDRLMSGDSQPVAQTHRHAEEVSKFDENNLTAEASCSSAKPATDQAKKIANDPPTVHSIKMKNNEEPKNGDLDNAEENLSRGNRQELSKEAAADSADLQVNPELRVTDIISEIEKTISTIKDDHPTAELKSVERSTENLPGRQISNLWFIALPPHSDGTYDPRNLQDDAYRKIRNAVSKNEATIIIAVYHGEIKTKHLSGAKSTAEVQKIILCNIQDLGETLGLFKIKFDGQSFIK